MRCLEWKGKHSGHVNDGLPWEHQKYTERIDALEKAQKALAKMPWPDYPGSAEIAEMRHQYDHFRATIERVIQDVVFNGVVKRYRDWIRVDSLEDVVGFESTEHGEIARLHKRCCDVVDAHDPSSAKNAAVPTAHEFGVDIDRLKIVIAAIKARRTKAKPGADRQSHEHSPPLPALPAETSCYDNGGFLPPDETTSPRRSTKKDS
jgi:hypothetical protein